ncbi:testis-expressed protein 53 [Equus caballus]|uniref:testis-expressed protein 53 n=1 Tax=Equus caballus TaxID=9796 RepID=UPI0038B36E15
MGFWDCGCRAGGPAPSSPPTAHQNMASKIFCCCCQASEGPPTTVRSPRASHQPQPRVFNVNRDSCKNNLQKRHPHHPSNNRVVKGCMLGRP